MNTNKHALRSRAPRRDERALGRALVFLVLGLVASAGVALRQAQGDEERARERFAALTDKLADDLVSRMHIYEYGLRGLRGVVLNALPDGELSEARFHAYMRSRDLASEFPGARGFGYIRRVSPHDERAFVAAARADGAPGFAIRTLFPHPGERWVIRYVHPKDRNEAAYGLDIASEPSRRDAALAAMKSGQARLTAPITLVQQRERAAGGFLLLLPVFPVDAEPRTPEERERVTLGFTYAPLVIDEVLASFDAQRSRVALGLADVTDAAHHVKIVTLEGGQSHEVHGPVRSFERRVYGRRWRIDARARPLFVAELAVLSPFAVFGLGAIATALFAGLVFASLQRDERERQAVLHETRLSDLVRSSSDAIVALTVEGRVVDWNGAAEQLFGRGAADATGELLSTLGLTTERGELAHWLARVARGEVVPPQDASCTAQSGEVREVSVAIAPARSTEGKVTGLGLTIRDVSAARQLERNLREFNARLEQEVRERTEELRTADRDLRTVMDALPSMVGYWDRFLRNRFANRAYADWFGVAPEAVRGKHIVELLGRELYEKNRPYMDAALAGTPQTFARDIPRPDGKGARAALTHYVPDLVDGEVRGFFVLVHDVSELVKSQESLKRTLEELARERLRLDNILLGTGAGTWEWNLDTDELRINARWAELLGHRPEELGTLTGAALRSHCHPDDRASMAMLLRRHLEGRDDALDCVTRARHRDGHFVWVLDRARVTVRHADGSPAFMHGTRQDVSLRMEAERRLSASEALLARVGEVAGVGGFELDVQTRALTWTSETRRIHGVPEDYRPAPADALADFPEPGRSELARAIERACGAGEPWDLELPLLGRDGRDLWVRVVGEAQYQGRDVVKLVGAISDVTARRSADEARSRAIVAARQASAAKSEFLANMSHEIRTPLNAIIGIAHLLERSQLGVEQRSFVARIHGASRTLLTLIDDILDLSKIEAGEMTLELSPFRLSALLGELESLFASQAETRGLALNIQSPERTVPLLGDVTRLRQILANLLSNALKFTEQGSVSLEVSTEYVDSKVQVQWTVRDTGIGIEAHAIARLFTPFTQADASTTRRFGGTGLGLSIVKKLATLMGGEVGVSSEPGRGSTFWVRTLHETARADFAVPRERERAFLLAVTDDLPDDPAALVRPLGWQLATCTLADVPSAAGAVVVRDRVRDGWLITACARPGDPPAYTVHVAKDALSSATLYNAVSASVGRPSAARDQLAAGTHFDHPAIRWLDGVRMLVVDDSEVNLDVARRMLESEGAHVQTCQNGRDAVARIVAAPGDFDAVLMDVQMPVMDGNEATRRLRFELGLTLPIIALSAGVTLPERERALACGTSEFVTKPLDPSVLVRAIRRQLELCTGRTVAALPRTAWRRPASPFPDLPGIDVDDVRMRLGDDLALFRSIVRHFLRDAQALIAELERDTESGQGTLRLLHKLRGSAGNVGASELARMAGAVEAQVRTGGGAGPLLASLAQAFARVRDGAEPFLREGLADEDAGAVLDRAALDQLRALLEGRELSALSRFRGLSLGLRARMEDHAFEQLREAVERLDFAVAVTLLPERPDLRCA